MKSEARTLPTYNYFYTSFESSTGSSSSVDQMDAGRRPLCPIHYTEKFGNGENQNNI